MCICLRVINLTLLLITLPLFLLSQDTIFIEDFQSGGLNGFTSLDEDQLTPISDFQGLSGGFQVAPISSSSDFRAIAVSAFENGGTADNWLISPVMDLTMNGAQLSWVAASLSGAPSQLENYRVMLSRNGGLDIADFTDILTIVNNESATPQQRSLDLSAYRGSQVRIAFHQNGIDNYALTVDDILVTQPSSAFAAEITDINGDRYQAISSSEIIVNIQNQGTEIIQDMTLEVTIVSGNGNLSASYGLNNLMLRPQEVTEFSIPNTDQLDADKLVMDFTIKTLNNEPYNSRNEKRTFFFFESGVQQVGLYEELTSTGCAICPQGIVDKQELKAHLGDGVVVLSIHTDDPMVLPLYELGFNSLEGSQGLPSAGLNRKLYGQTTELTQSITRMDAALAPISISTDYAYDPATRVLNYRVEGTAFTTLEMAIHRLVLLIVEDSVQGADPTYDQSNIFSFEASDLMLSGPDGKNWQSLSDPVPADEMQYDDVVREAIGGFGGEMGSVSAVGVGETFEQDFQYVVPSTFNENNLRMVVLALDTESGEILQAYEEALDFMSIVTEADFEVNIFPNPAVDEIYVELQIGFKVDKLIFEDIQGRRLDDNVHFVADDQLVMVKRLGLPAGMYFLRFQIGQNQQVYRLMFVD